MISFRFQRLIEKLLSVKFVIFIIATVLLCCGVLGGAEWLTVALTVIAGREIATAAEAREILGLKKHV